MAIQSEDLNFKLLVSVLGAQAIDDLRGKMKTVGDATESTKKGLEAASEGLKKLGEFLAVEKIFEYTKGVIEAGAQLAILSQRTGLSVEQLSSLKGAAEIVGVSIDSVATGMKRFNVALIEAREGNKEVTAAFNNLGISTAEVKNKKPDEIIAKLADGFAKFADGPEKTANAIKIFGRGADELIPILDQGSKALTDFGDGFTTDFAERAHAFDSGIEQIKQSLSRIAVGAIGQLLPALQDIMQVFRDSPQSVGDLSVAMDVVGEVIRNVAIVFNTFSGLVIEGIDTIIYMFRAAASEIAQDAAIIGETLSTAGAQIKAQLTLNFSELEKISKESEDRKTAIAKQGAEDRQKLFDDFADRTNKRYKEMSDRNARLDKNDLIFGQGSIDEIKKRMEEATKPEEKNNEGKPKPSTEGISNAGNAEANKLKNELASAEALREAGLEQVKLEMLKANAFSISSAELAKQTAIEQSSIEVTKATKNMTDQGAQAYRDSANAVLKAKLALIEYQDEQKHSFGVGAQQAIHDYVESVKDVAAQTKQAMTNAFKGMEDALISFVKTGKLNFTSLADSIITDLIRIAIRQGITGPIAQGLGSVFSGGGSAASGGVGSGAAGGFQAAPFANGGIMTSRGMAKLSTYAVGGIANSPQLAIYGEGSTPEAYVPLPDGKRIPVSLKGSGSGDTQINISVNMATGTEQTDVKGDAQRGAQLGRLISSAVKNELLQQRRPGGLLAGA